MWSRIRTSLLWLLMAALPVQSWAVATMVNCGPNHHEMSAQSASHSGQSHAADEHEAAHGPDHHQDLEVGTHDLPDDSAASTSATSSTDAAGTDHHPLKLGKFKCSACATCCLGLALPSPILTFDAAVSSDTIEPGIKEAAPVFLTTGLDRPPRTLPA